MSFASAAPQLNAALHKAHRRAQADAAKLAAALPVSHDSLVQSHRKMLDRKRGAEAERCAQLKAVLHSLDKLARGELDVTLTPRSKPATGFQMPSFDPADMPTLEEDDAAPNKAP